MQTQVVGAILKYNATGVNDYGFEINTHVADKAVSYKFTKTNGYMTEVPIKVSHKNLAGKEVIDHENYAQFLLDSYPHLSLVKMVEKSIVETPILVDKRASANNELAKAQAEVEELKRKLAEAEALKETVVETPAETKTEEVPVVLTLEEQTVKQLKEYAVSKGIDIPYNVTVKQDIINFIKEKETV